MTVEKLTQMIEAKKKYLHDFPEDINPENHIQLYGQENFEFCERNLKKKESYTFKKSEYHNYELNGMVITILTDLSECDDFFISEK